MKETVRRRSVMEQAKRIHAAPLAGGQPGGPQSTASPRDFRPRPTAPEEAGESLARALRVEKAETIGERVGVSRALVYEWAGSPARIPLGALAEIAAMDPDPDALVRIAHALLVRAAALAAERKADGEIAVRLYGKRPAPTLPFGEGR